MKKVILILVCVVVLFFVLKLFVGSGSEKAFKEFSESWALNRLGEAMNYGAPGLREDLKGLGVNDVTHHMMESIMGVTVHVDSMETSPAGEGVDARGRILILFNPPGVTSAMRATMAARIETEAIVIKTPDGWKVSSFTPTLLEMKELKAE
ncbi:MAG TPA: hypothetical protein PK014_00565 [Thermoanaerobaculia bacterium]|nr:hypothetical protein [Thermoanaerobaculia bacterium]HXK66964.1 hypothetical protein [Thermoanaerobaculia bacterium]